MILVLCEKPSQARDIAKAITHRGKWVKEGETGYYEDSKYIITNCIGHLYQAKLPNELNSAFSSWNLNDLPFSFEKLEFKPKESTIKQLALVNKLISRSDIDELALATDPDREGELLGRIVINLNGNSTIKKYTRIWLESLSSDEIIKKAVDERIDLAQYDKLYLSAVARQYADYHVGLNATMGMSAKMHQKYTLGRVQTPTLRMVVDRELEIKNFVVDTYYKLKANCEGYIFDYIGIDEEDVNFKTKDDVIKKINEIGLGNARIVELLESEVKDYAPKLFSLADLQIEMNKKYGYKAQQVLNICQALYETYKITTYPRTDENFITEATLSQMDKIINSLPNLFNSQVNFIKSNSKTISSKCIAKKEIGSHEALQPVVANKKISDEVINSLKEDELNVYKAIVERFLSNFYDPAVYLEQKVFIEKNGNSFKYFTKTLKDRGYLNALSDYEEQSFEPFIKKQEGEFISVDKFIIKDEKSKPKQRFTEGSLIKAMKNPVSYLDEGTKDIYEDSIVKCGGIGTEATRGQIIEDLKKRDYIELKGKSLYATTKGIELIQLLPSKDLKSIELTSKFEANLELIRKGDVDIDEFKASINELDKEIIDEMKGISETDVSNVKQNTIINNSICNCPNCEGYIIKGQYGYFCNKKCGVVLNYNMLEKYGKKNITEKEAVDILNNSPTKKTFKFISAKTGNEYEAKIKYDFKPNDIYKNNISLIFPEKKKEKVKTKKHQLIK